MDLGELHIDIQQLPIPDWNLPCPRCRYCLNGLPAHRCPECGLEFDMADVVRPWHKLREPRLRGDELPFPDFGLQCEACQAPLAGATAHACPKCGAAFDPRLFVPRQDWFTVEPGQFGAVRLPLIRSLLISECVPFREDETKSPYETFGSAFPLAGRLVVLGEFFFEFRWLVRLLLTESEGERREWEGWAWLCRACREEVPGHFEACWNCGAARSENLKPGD